MGSQPLLGILVGAIVHWYVSRGSSAVAGIVIAFAWQGIIDLPAGLALRVGATLVHVCRAFDCYRTNLHG